MSFLKQSYNDLGYVIVKSGMSDRNVMEYRGKILKFFQKNPDERQMTPTNILKSFPEIYEIQTNQKLLSSVKEIFGAFSFVNNFQIQKNMCNLSHTGGWHIDSQNQYITGEINASNDKNHRVAKMGLCLTADNCRFGQFIEIVPRSHRLDHRVRFLLRKFLDLKLVPWFMKRIFVTKLDKIIGKGDFVIFDSKLLHRSATADKENIKDIFGFNSFEVADDSKLTVYFEVGEAKSVNTLLQSALTHAMESERGSDKEKFISDYMRVDRSSIPPEVVAKVRSYGGTVAVVSEHDRSKADEIYNS
tara:strand:+ start:1199 stop:2104 length:906 start_codon:yes stop_codon:yes gene_type:complete